MFLRQIGSDSDQRRKMVEAEIKAYTFMNFSICKGWTDGIDIIEGWVLKVQS